MLRGMLQGISRPNLQGFYEILGEVGPKMFFIGNFSRWPTQEVPKWPRVMNFNWISSALNTNIKSLKVGRNIRIQRTEKNIPYI